MTVSPEANLGRPGAHSRNPIPGTLNGGFARIRELEVSMARSLVGIATSAPSQGLFSRPASHAGVAALFLSLVACGGGGGGYSSGTTPPPPPPTYQVSNLVSDQPAVGAATTDTHLVNAWGLAYGPSTDFWVANQATATSTVYDGAGKQPAVPIVVSVPLMAGHVMVGPTGMVFNGSTGFLGDEFMVASLEGCICGWSAGTTMTRRVDNSASNATYTGLAIGSNGTATFL